MKRCLLLATLALTACSPQTESSDEAAPARLQPLTTGSTIAGTEVQADTVNIRRDPYGVPLIQASSDAAAFYGLGWASAQDRRFQMELAVLTVQGTLAEHFGGTYEDSDTYARQVFAWEAAQAKVDPELGAFDANTLALLQAYADGVNAYTADHPSPTFAAFGLEPQTWTPAHSMAAWFNLAIAFAPAPWPERDNRRDFDEDVARLGSVDEAAKAWLSGFHPGVPSAGVVQLDDLDDDYVERVNAYATKLGFGEGAPAVPAHTPSGPAFSHAYAVHPDRTDEGASILVADPQLDVLLPSVFYEFHLDSPGFLVRGVGVPGVPATLIGTNAHVAWGLTASSGDQLDLFRITEGQTPNTYVIDGVEHPMLVESTTILVDGGDPVTLERRWTRFGPDVSALLPVEDPHDATADRHPYVMRSVLYDEVDRSTLVSLFDLMRAQDLDGLKEALATWRAPVVNLVAADANDIYYSLVGAMPIRSADAPIGGYVAQDATSWTDDWRTTIPHDVMPQVTSPAAGVVYSANHRPAGDWYPLPLPLPLPVNAGGHTTRSARLRDQLGTTRRFTVHDLIADVQNDCVHHNLTRVVSLGLNIRDRGYSGFSADASATLTALQDWAADGGSLLSDRPVGYVATGILTSFRATETGQALQDTYSGGPAGMTYFLDVLEARMDQNPKLIPGSAELAYLDTIFAGAADRVAMSDEARAEAWAEEHALTLNLHTTFNGPALDTGHSVAATVQCATKASIWSQSGQAFSQVVDFAGYRGSVLPVGTSEQRTDPWHTSEQTLWEDGLFKDAPVLGEAVDAIVDPAHTVTLTPAIAP